MTTSARIPPVPANKKADPEHVLLIAADAVDTARVLGELDSVTEEQFQVEWVTDLSSGIERLADGGVGAAVVDLNLPGTQGIESLDKVVQAAPDVPVLILSEGVTEETARHAVQRGADDYLVKEQADGYRLRRTVRTMMDRRTARDVALENEISSATLNSIGAGILRTDLHGKITYLNRFAESMTGWLRDEAMGRPVADVLQLIDSTTGAAVDNAVATVMDGDNTSMATICSIDCTLIRRDGVKLGIENRVTTIDDEDGKVLGVVMAFRDVSEARAASVEMSRMAQHDVLTRLPNRTLFNDRLKQAILLAERQGKQLAVLFVDLDQFKRINDSLGHAMGDKLLRSVAGRLMACIRRADTVCRLGGDEFVVLLAEVSSREAAAAIARKILRAVAAPHIIDNKSLDLSASIGGSIYPGDGQDAEILLGQADAAMYEAKKHGRSGYQFYRSDMRVQLAKRLLLEEDLRYALGRNEFALHYQPKIDLQTGQITGMEALIRWMHPVRGMLYPGDFIHVAEECGLIEPIGQWVLLEACRQSRKWSEAGFGIIPVAVNVSAAEFLAKDYLSGVRAVLIATGVEPGNLELELTESVLMQDAEAAVVTLHALKEMGIQLAIDDFGTGYSSFTYLQRFPMDTIKVDRSFVQEISAKLEDITIVSAMIDIGKSMNRRIVAEGVETLSQLEFLQRHACSEGQGYYFSHPLVAEQAGNVFKTGLRPGLVQ
jgi:diguanylate cyclase (GGDEF)-like protein/PAS domain S-box-containing protein